MSSTGRWIRKLRGVLGLSVLGGSFGAILGVAWGVSRRLLTEVGVAPLEYVLLNAGVWGGFGVFAAGGVGLLIAVVGSGRDLSELSVWRAGLFGAVLGYAAPVGLALLFGAGLHPAGVSLWASTSGALGCLLGGGLVAAAKRAEASELQAPPDPKALGR